MRTVLAVAAALLLAPSLAPAASRSDEDTALSLARTAEVLVGEGDLDGAIRLFRKAYELEASPVLLYNIARLHDRKDDRVRARELYEEYLALEKDPEGQSRGRMRLEELLDRIPGTLVVVSDPPGATVRVDGGAPLPTGVEELPLKLKRGAHEIVVTLDRFAPATRTVEVVSGRETLARVALAPLPGRLEVVCNEGGAQVEVDGRPVGTCPIWDLVEVAAGKHVVSVTSAGFENFVEAVDIRSEENSSVTVRLVPLPAEARPVASPAPAPDPAPSPAGPGLTDEGQPLPEPYFERLPADGAAALLAPAPLPAAGPAPPAEPVATVAQPAPSRGVSPWQWAAIGVGAGLLAGGGACTLVSWLDRRAVDQATTSGGVVTGITRADALSREARANNLTKASWALYAVGGAALVTGVILAVLPSETPSPEPAPAGALAPIPGGAMAVLSGTF